MQCFHFTCFVESLYVFQETSYPEDFAKPASMDRSHVTAKSVHRVRNVLAGLLLLSHSLLIQILPHLLISRLMLTFPKQILSLNPSFGCKQGVKTSQQVPRICIPESNKKVKESSLRLIWFLRRKFLQNFAANSKQLVSYLFSFPKILIQSGFQRWKTSELLSPLTLGKYLIYFILWENIRPH